jgi:hypothetical protein
VDKPPIPADLTKSHNTWFWMGVILQTLIVVLGAIAVLASIGLTAFEPELRSWGENGFGIRLVAFVSAVASGLLGGLGIVQKNRDIWGSWRAVRSARLRYADDPDFTFKDLMDTYERAEQLMGEIGFFRPSDP